MNGNRCEHHSTSPLFYAQPLYHKKRPHILEDAIQRLEKIYFKPREFFRKFSLPRLKRSERREAIICTLQFLLHYTELSTLKIVKNDIKFDNFSLTDVCRHTMLSISRVKRAICDLVKAGYLKIIKQFKKEDGEHKGRPSIREILPVLFIDLGVDMSKFNFSRHYKRTKLEKKFSKSGLFKLRQIIKTIGFKKPTMQSLINLSLQKHRENPLILPSDYFRQLTRQKE